VPQESLAASNSYVEQLMEYQGAERMPALQHFILDLVEGIETCVNISSDSEHFILYFKKKHFVQNVLG